MVAADQSGLPRAMLPLALIVFFVSGFAALLYQVIWQRLLGIFSGTDVYSATIIVAAFMAGLGIGHLAGGHAADRVSRRASLVLFGVAEIAIAVFAVFSTSLYYDLLYRRLGGLQLTPETTAIVLFGGLLWPTVFMGASLPLLARAMTDRIDRAARTVGALYGFNTLGAATGAAIATWFLLPRLGLEGSLRVGAVLNVACATLIAPFALRFQAASSGQSDVASRGGAPGLVRASGEVAYEDGRFPFWFWALAYGLAGFVALSYEIVWFRLLGVMMKSTAFTFGTLLTLYLSGLGAGAALGSAVAPRVRRAGIVFFACEAAAGLSAAFLLVILVGVADDARALRGYFASYEPLNVRESVQSLLAVTADVLRGSDSAAPVPANFLRLYVLLPLLLVVPPTFLMGYAFPFLQRVVHRDSHLLGRRLGALLLANVLGSILGTVLTGWLSLAVFGTAATLKLLVVLSGLFALGVAMLAKPSEAAPQIDERVECGSASLATVLACPASGRGSRLEGRTRSWTQTQRFRAFKTGSRLVPMLAVVTLAAGMLIRWVPDGGLLWARLHGTTPDRIIFAEDSSGLSVIKTEDANFSGQKIVFVNGMGQSVLPYGDIHTVLGALPALVHEDPRDIAIIGLGSGDTAYAAASRLETERIVCVEIIRPQLATLWALAQRDAYGGLHALLRDSRIEHAVGDGRAFLMRTNRKFDIIEADALRPTSAYSGSLYSEAYFTLVRSRLKPHGLAATWVPTKRIGNTFIKVFPYVVNVPGVLIGSNEPFDMHAQAIAKRLADPRVRDHYARAGVDIAALLAPYFKAASAPIGPEFNRAALLDVNTDLFPKDEYDLTSP
jgi:spermidine synthase